MKNTAQQQPYKEQLSYRSTRTLPPLDSEVEEAHELSESMHVSQSATASVHVTENKHNERTSASETTGTTTGTSATVDKEEVIVVETVDSLDSDTDMPQRSDVEYDRMERFVGSVIHWILAFFALMAVAAMVMVILLISKFGFIVFILVGMFMFVLCAFVYFVEKTIRRDEHWKPLKSSLQRIKDIATDAIMTEVKNFKTDYFEYLMLTNGEEEDEARYPNDDVNQRNNNGHVDPATGFVSMEEGQGNNNNSKNKSKTRRLAGAGRSVVFKMVKPFLKLRSPLKNRRNSKAARATRDNQNAETKSYVPPIV